MDYTKIIIAILTAACTVLSLIGVINTEESGTLVTSGTAAATGVSAFVAAIVAIVKAHRKGGGDEGANGGNGTDTQG